MQSFDEILANPLVWRDFRDTAVGRYLLEQEHEFINQAIAQSAPRAKRILEIACCTGRVSEPLRKAGHHVVGVDLDPYALHAYRTDCKDEPLVRGDGLELPFGANSFDCTLAIQCISYFNPSDILEECKRVLVPGGLLIFDVTNRRNYKRALKQLLGATDDFRVADAISTAEWMHLLESHRFAVQAVRGYNWVPFVPERARFSDSKLVGVAAHLERVLHLHRLPAYSPWLLIAAVKRSHGHGRLPVTPGRAVFW